MARSSRAGGWLAWPRRPFRSIPVVPFWELPPGQRLATLVGAVTRPLTAEASTDSVQYINDQNSHTVIEAHSLHQDGFPDSGKGIAVAAFSDSGIAVQAIGFDSYGVYAHSLSGTGVYADSFGGVAVQGRGASTGVYGAATHALPPAAPSNVGVYGYSDMPESRGVYGATTDTTSETYGVLGTTQGSQARAVFGWSLNEKKGGTGVFGQSSSGDGVGVRGYAWDGYGKSGIFGTGVLGSSGSHAYPPPAARPNTGVMGVAVGDSGAIGVLGSSGPGTGVTGTSTTGTGVQGASTSGPASGAPAARTAAASSAARWPSCGCIPRARRAIPRRACWATSSWTPPATSGCARALPPG